MKNLLTDKSIRQALKEGHTKDGKTGAADGDGLTLTLKAGQAGRWRLRYHFGGKEKMLSFGVYPAVSLAMAREKRDAAKRLLSDGIDPSAQRKAEKAEKAAPAAHKTTFGELADSWFVLKMKQQGKRTRTLERECWLIRVLKGDGIGEDKKDDGKGAFGRRPVDEIKRHEIVTVIEPEAKLGHHETVSRLCSTAARIFDHGTARGILELNPAVGLSKAFTSPKAKHRPALTEPGAVAELMRDIDAYRGKGPTVRDALRLEVLTFVRPGELRLAEWSEFDAGKAIWSIPKEKMKMDRPHQVPLSRQALALIAQIRKRSGDGTYLFPGERTGATISENTLNEALRVIMGYCTASEHCAHGFRTTASTLLNAERDREERRVWDQLAIEFQLAHIDETTRGIYDRDPLWAERVRLMQHWADKVDTLRAGGAKIVPLAAGLSS